MISEGEAFGLVYLEAMSRGCITIASKNEGMDGIIKDGINGFLCESGNQFDLENKLRFISCLSTKEIKVIKINAIHTAQEYTNEKAALKYLNLINN
jgi:glycosyltransferase involved in cell wall biosynthesis